MSAGKTSLESLMWAATLLDSLLTEAEKKEAVKRQCVSWVYGNVALSGSNVTREQVEEIVSKYEDIRKMSAADRQEIYRFAISRSQEIIGDKND